MRSGIKNDVKYLNHLNPTGHVMHRQFNNQQLYLMHICADLLLPN